MHPAGDVSRYFHRGLWTCPHLPHPSLGSVICTSQIKRYLFKKHKWQWRCSIEQEIHMTKMILVVLMTSMVLCWSTPNCSRECDEKWLFFLFSIARCSRTTSFLSTIQPIWEQFVCLLTVLLLRLKLKRHKQWRQCLYSSYNSHNSPPPSISMDPGAVSWHGAVSGNFHRGLYLNDFSWACLQYLRTGVYTEVKTLRSQVCLKQCNPPGQCNGPGCFRRLSQMAFVLAWFGSTITWGCLRKLS